MVSLARFREPAAAKLTVDERERWRGDFAADVLSIASASTTRLHFMQRLVTGMVSAGLGNPESQDPRSDRGRLVYPLPFDMVLKVEYEASDWKAHVDRRRHWGEWEKTEEETFNFAEEAIYRSLPLLCPRVYGRHFGGGHAESVNVLMEEAVVPLNETLGHYRDILLDGGNNATSWAIRPEAGQLVLVYTGAGPCNYEIAPSRAHHLVTRSSDPSPSRFESLSALASSSSS